VNVPNDAIYGNGENDVTCANRLTMIESALVRRRSTVEVEEDRIVERNMTPGIAAVMGLSHTSELELDWCCMDRLPHKYLSHTLLEERISHEE